METYSFEFPPQNVIFKFIFTKNCNYRWKTTCLKSRMEKNRIEKSSFFNEISLKYKDISDKNAETKFRKHTKTEN